MTSSPPSFVVASPQPDPRRKLAVLAVFVAASIVMLYPQSVQLADHVPHLTDPLENSWVLAWDTHELVSDPLALYQANIFYPYANSLAFSESQVASAVTAMPVYLDSNNPILAYNFVFLLSFIFCAFGTFLLAYDVSGSHWGAILAGFAFAFWAYKMSHIGHLNLETLQWLPLVFFAARRCLSTDSRSMRVLLAISFSAQALSSWYSALMTGLGLVVYGLCYALLRRSELERKRALPFLVTLAASIALVAVVAIPYFQVSRELGFARSESESELLSASPESFLSVPGTSLLYHNILPQSSAEPLFPGALLLGLAVVGTVTKRPLLDRAFWITLVPVFAIIALGPTLNLSAGWPALPLPYRILYDYVPGIQGTRAPARFFVMGMLGLCVLAANGFARLANHKWRWTAFLGAAGLVVMGLEYAVLPLPVVATETGTQVPSVYRWLATQPPGNVLELPTLPGDIGPVTRAMYFSTFHWHALPVGYGSFVPQTQIDLLRIINSSLNPVTLRLVNILREFDVKYLILHGTGYSSNDLGVLQGSLATADGLLLARTDEADSVYEVTGTAPLHPLTFGSLLPRQATAGRTYRPYLVILQPRRYPIVTGVERNHVVNITWRNDGAAALEQTISVSLPQILLDRPEGVGLPLVAPGQPGSYQLEWSLDGQQLKPVDLNDQVLVQPGETVPSKNPPIELLSYTIGPKLLSPGAQGNVNLFWRRVGEIRENYEVRISLISPEGERVWSEKRQPVQWTFPTQLWRDGGLVTDAHGLNVPENALPGSYSLRVELTRPNSDERVSFRDPAGHVTAQFAADSLVVAP